MAAEDVTELPEYVEYGFRSSFPGPFLCRNSNMQMAVVKGDSKCIEDLIERTLTVPAKGKIEYRPLGNRVLLLYGYNLVSSAQEPWSGYGAVNENLVSFWVPVWAGHTEPDGSFHSDRLVMSLPFILVDNPMSHLAGREIYGFPKALGQFEQNGERLVVNGYGGKYGPDECADWQPVLELAPAGDGTESEERIEGGDALEQLARALTEADEGEELIYPSGLLHALREMAAEGPRIVFLKQFRSAGDQRRAAYQGIVEAPAPIRRLKLHKPLRNWQVTVFPLDSHPLTKELGIDTQHTRWSVHLTDFDFEVLAGEVVAP